MNNFKINFVNHSCFKVQMKNFSFLVDPWFSGTVFNNSWKLLKETNIKEIDLSDLKYIFISHEHPDHLNFKTLKEIYEINKDVKIIFPYREDPLVQRVLEKIGFKFHFIKQNSEKFFIDEINYVKFFSNNMWGDHTIVFSLDNKIIVNQNDDYTEKNTVKKILKEFKKVDLFFTQFSLAGYYGNSDNPSEIMEKGHKYHLNRVKSYFNDFKPKILVPFASYIYFCKESNKFLNNFSVKPSEVLNLLGNKNCQLVSFNDEIYLDHSFEERNKENAQKLEKLFQIDNEKKFIPIQKLEENQIKDIIQKKIEKISFFQKVQVLVNNKNSIIKNILGFIKIFYLMADIKIYVYDIKKIIKVNLFSKKIDISDYEKKINFDFYLPSEDLLFMFKFPWGSDTVNISSTVNHYSKKSFIFFFFLKRHYYRFGFKGA